MADPPPDLALYCPSLETAKRPGERPPSGSSCDGYSRAVAHSRRQ